MSGAPVRPLARRLFRRSLVFFPPAFRDRYGAELLAAFDDQAERLREASGARRVAWLVSTLADTAASGLRERMRAGGPDGRRVRNAPLEAATQALAFTLRGARRAPGFTLAVVVTLGLGIGATTMMYGIADRLLLRPPQHIVDPERVALIYFDRVSPFTHTRRIDSGFSHPDLLDLGAVEGFASIAGFVNETRTLGAGSDAERIHTQLAGAALFDLLGARPQIGRFYSSEEDRIGGATVAVLSDAFWTRRFGRDPGILGRELDLGSARYTVIGVAPPGFTGATIQPVDAWLPFLTTQALDVGEAWRNARSWVWFETVARLRHGVDRTAVEAEVTAAHRAGRESEILAGRYDPNARAVLASLVPGQAPDAGSEVAVSRWLLGVALVVMLIACANVANLLLLRGVRRRRELAIRVALGITRRRLFLQLLTESLILAGAAAVSALLLARWGGMLVYRTLLPDLDPGGVLSSPRLLVFAAGAAGVAALLAGTVPAALASRPDVQRDLKEAGRSMSSHRLRSGLVVLQVALSVVLLAGAGLFLRSLARVHDLDLGFAPDGVVWANVRTGDGSFDGRSARAVTEAAERLRTAPGIAATAVTNLTPFGGWWGRGLRRADGDSVRVSGGGPYYYVTSPDYFRVMSMRIVRGRGFTSADVGEGARPVMVLTEGLARTAFGEEDPLGRCLLVEPAGTDDPPCTEVVGILANHRSRRLVEDATSLFYLPLGHPAAQRVQTLVVRGSGDTGATVAAVRAALFEALPGARYVWASPLTDRIDALSRSWRLGATLLVLFGALALCVAALGLHAVVGFELAQRRSELGIRVALGAARGRLVTMVLRATVARAAVGALLGVAVVVALSGTGRDLLFHTSPADPAVLAVASLTLVAVAAVAALRPAARAARVPPTEALRSDV